MSAAEFGQWIAYYRLEDADADERTQQEWQLRVKLAGLETKTS